ncbi:hypothetical protein G7077_05990 [Sphingomonas piscis]|uniref:AcrB/AcrD/AcrF family protein n=1 Tax=Sphingomonas piscis TaxID=2714943 RepID=A0A6G7YP61_9SPHN|nr:hypothetical protein [Sphingomonas piscis]QIK78516.1 hypothetical protein G7077_05990 [Sphingomonas piscis]
MLAWFRRHDRTALLKVIAIALPCLTATALLFWQTRTGPAAQMLGTIGVSALIWLLPSKLRSPNPLLKAFVVLLFVAASAGAVAPLVVDAVPDKPPTKRAQAVNRANRMCNAITSFRPIARLPRGTVFTFVDTGPRLITVTHHSAVAGPYHRNAQQIVDIMKAFRGSEPEAHAIIAKYRADYVLTCPNASTTTIFRAEAPEGFYGQLANDQIPEWLTPIPLPKGSPFRMWRVVR